MRGAVVFLVQGCFLAQSLLYYPKWACSEALVVVSDGWV